MHGDADQGRPFTTQTVLTAFEATMLVRAASRTTDPSAACSGVVEFSFHAAAERLLVLLDQLDVPSRPYSYVAGGRRQYTVYGVICTELDAPTLREGWRIGYDRLIHPDPALRGRRQVRVLLAIAAWRALLLVNGNRRPARMPVRVADATLAAVAVRAALVLDVSATMHTRGRRCHLVSLGGNGHRAMAAICERSGLSAAG